MNGDPLLVNKVVGSVIFAGLIAMVAGFIANLAYSPQMLDKMAYKIGGNAPVQSASATAAPAGPEDITGMLASADAAADAAARKAEEAGGPLMHIVVRQGLSRVACQVCGMSMNVIAQNRTFFARTICRQARPVTARRRLLIGNLR